MKIDGTRSHDRASELVLDYYAALNRNDIDGVLALLTEDVVHELNQGPREVGHAAFAAFLQRMEACYHEQLRDLVVMSSPDGQRAAAEYMVHGEYVADDIGMPPARGQKYVMPGAAFFAFHDGRIRRITDCYNVQEWLAQVA
jgi:steroid delta-isomerase-like uncharacterized protein